MNIGTRYKMFQGGEWGRGGGGAGRAKISRNVDSKALEHN